MLTKTSLVVNSRQMEEELLPTREVAKILKPHEIGTEAGVRDLVKRGELHPAVVEERGKRKIFRFRLTAVKEFIWRRRWTKGPFLDFPTFKEMIEKVGDQIKSYFGEEPGCIAALMPGGFPYALVLLSYLVHEQRCDINLIFLQRGETWKPELLNGKKILIVDSRTQSGKSLTKAKQVFKKT